MIRPLNIVHVISALPVGGVERNMVRVLPRLDPERFRVSVVCTRETGDLAPEMEAAGVPVRLVRQRTRYDPLSLWRLRRHLLEARADIVHCHMRRANTSGRIAAIWAGVPVRIATERDMGLDKTRRHYLVDRWLGWRSDAIVCVTRAVAEHEQRLSGLPREKFRVIYNGLDLERFLCLPGRDEARARLFDGKFALRGLRPMVIGCVARLEEIKRIDAVVRAMARPEMAGGILCLVGDGRERGPLERLGRDLGLDIVALDRPEAASVRPASDNGRTTLVFTGFRADLSVIYAALDVAVLASRSEGIANAQMEALAAGVPLVTTPVGIAHEALDAGRDYIEVEGPDPALLARAMAEALQPERAAALRDAGRKAIASFSIEAQARNLEALYAELAGKRGVGVG